MLNYLFRRLNLLFITAFILTIIAFVLTYWSTYWQTSQSNYIGNYFHYLFAIISGEWGLSVLDQQPILSKGLSAFGSTLKLSFIAFIIANIIAFPLGILAGLNRDKTIDYIIMGMVLVGLAIPVFWLAAICTILPNLLGLTLPADTNINTFVEVQNISGLALIDALLTTDTYRPSALLSHLIHLLLPSAVLSLFLISEITRLTRHSITTIIKSNYIKAAYAKGLSSKQIVFNHVIKNALPPIIHQIRLQLSTIISFAMVIEIVFSMPGTGTWLLNSIQQGDFLALPTAVLLVSGFILLTSILVDILLVVISPIKRKSLYVD
jgi:cationic peptide transport system permease protein